MSKLLYLLLFLAVSVNVNGFQADKKLSLSGLKKILANFDWGLGLWNKDDDPCDEEEQNDKEGPKADEPTTTMVPVDKCGVPDDDKCEVLDDDKCTCGENGFNETAYCGGPVKNRAKWPWLLSLFVPGAKDPWGTCSAVLTRVAGYALTTASCIEGIEAKDLRVRGPNGCTDDPNEEFEVEKATPHYNYKKKWRFDEDFAVIKFKKELPCTTHSLNICFPSASHGLGQVGDTMITATTDKDNAITEGTVEVQDPEACGDQTDADKYCTKDTEKLVCKGGIGGPAMQYKDGVWYVQRLAVADPRNCNEEGPTLYTKVENYWNFYKSQTT